MLPFPNFPRFLQPNSFYKNTIPHPLPHFLPIPSLSSKIQPLLLCIRTGCTLTLLSYIFLILFHILCSIILLLLYGASCLATNLPNLHIREGLCNSKVAVTLVKGRRRSLVEMSTKKIEDMRFSRPKSVCYDGG